MKTRSFAGMMYDDACSRNDGADGNGKSDDEEEALEEVMDSMSCGNSFFFGVINE